MAQQPSWRSRRAGRLVLRFREHSLAAQDIDELETRFSHALGAVVEALDLDAAALPPITVYLADRPPAHEGHARPDGDGRAAPGGLSIWAAYSSESPSVAPEIELTRALLVHRLGQPGPAGRFWDEGLAGYLAARSGRSAYHAEAGPRCRQLLADGLLPPLEELLAETGERVSALAGTVAGAFAEYVIERYGIARYRQLLVAARDGATDAFDRVYRWPLAVVDRDWRRSLEAAGRAGESSTWQTARRLLPLMRPYWRSGLLILLYTLVGIAFSLVIPLAFRFLMDAILSRRPLQEPVPLVGPSGYVISAGREQLETLVELMVFLGLLYIISAIARLRLNRLLNVVGESFGLDLRRRLLEQLGSLPAAYFARTPTADINQRVVQDVLAIQQAITGALIPIVSALLSIVLYATLLFLLQARLALIALLGLPFLALIYHLRRRSRRAANRERVRRLADLSARVNEFADAHLFVKVYAAAEYLLGRLAGRMAVHRQLNIAYVQENSLLGQVAILIMNLSQIAVLLAGGYLVIASGGRDLAPGGLVAFYIVLNQLFAPLNQLTTASQTMAGVSANLERVAELLAQPTEQDRPDGIEFGPLRDALRFEDVGFAYSSGRPVLKQLRLTIPAGATVAFVGATGAGKSSLVQLLPRLYDPTHGTITWDGVDLRAARLASLRRQVILVPQDPLLLSATVYENIRFGLEGVSYEAVRRAAQLAGAHDFIAALPDGYDTVLGEHGTGLSGGQRQRVGLARALLRNPSVLILDEATSALDATTQRAVQEGLRTAAAGRTIVKIAHRLETVAAADRIFVLDDGRLVEQGKHAELLAAEGVYARLFKDQMSALYAAGKPSARQAARWLARLAPFSELPPAALDDLAATLVTTERRAGATIYRQGEPSDELFVLGRGRVEVLRLDESGPERLISTLGTGATFGDASFFQAGPRSATVRAATDVLLFTLHRAAFQAGVGRANGGAGTARPEAVAARSSDAGPVDKPSLSCG